MKWMKTLLIAFALIAGSTGIAVAQEGYSGWQNRPYDRDGDHDRDRDRNRDRDHDRYRNLGQWGYQNDHDRDDGYYRNDHDRDDDYRGGYRGQYPVYQGQYPVYQGQYPVYGGPYNQGPYYRTGMQQAQQNGYQWGLRDGQVDRQAGRSYRATSNETYRHGSAGYVSAYGNKAQYQSVFRQAYQQGYQRGYGSGAYGQARRWPYHR